MDYPTYLKHYGVLGMHWGVRKKEQSAYLNKIKTLAEKNPKNVSYRARTARESDAQRFRYRNQDLKGRVIDVGKSLVISKVVWSVVTGSFGKIPSTPAELAKKTSRFALSLGVNVALNDALAKSASKRYLSTGKHDPKAPKQGLFTKEEKIIMGIRAGILAAPLIEKVLRTKISDVAKRKRQDQERFNQWGGNILAEKLPNFDFISGAGEVIKESPAKFWTPRAKTFSY